VSLHAIPTYKRVEAWFLGPAEDTERYLLRLRRLNQGLDTRKWRVYELREESSGFRLVFSIDATFNCVEEVEIEALQWCVEGHILPPTRQVREAEIREEEEEVKEEAERGMVSAISFIQANLPHTIAASGIISRTVVFI